MVVSSYFQHGVDLGKRYVGADAIKEDTKTLAGVFKGQSWAMLEALMASEQGDREEACHMGALADVYPNVQCLMSQHWDHMEIGAHFGSSRHKLVSLHHQSRRRSKVPWARLYQLRMRSMASKLGLGVRTRPPAFKQESSSKGGIGFCGTYFGGERPRRASPATRIHLVLYENKSFV